MVLLGVFHMMDWCYFVVISWYEPSVRVSNFSLNEYSQRQVLISNGIFSGYCVEPLADTHSCPIFANLLKRKGIKCLECNLGDI